MWTIYRTSKTASASSLTICLYFFHLCENGLFRLLCVFTPQAPRSTSQRGKARPKTSRVSKKNTSLSRNSNFGFTWVGTTVPPRMTMSDNRVFTVMQDIAEASFNQTATAPAFGTIYYLASDLDQFANFAVIFDQYRIEETEVTFRPAFTDNSLSFSTIVAPLLYVVVDYDDSSVPSTLAQLREYSNCTQSLYETQVRRFKPHVAIAAYASTFTEYANVESPWIDCTGNAIQHYGIKYGCDAGVTAQTNLQHWIIQTRHRISFRNIH
jgi:hypothetical protein